MRVATIVAEGRAVESIENSLLVSTVNPPSFILTTISPEQPSTISATATVLPAQSNSMISIASRGDRATDWVGRVPIALRVRGARGIATSRCSLSLTDDPGGPRSRFGFAFICTFGSGQVDRTATWYVLLSSISPSRSSCSGTSTIYDPSRFSTSAEINKAVVQIFPSVEPLSRKGRLHVIESIGY